MNIYQILLLVGDAALLGALLSTLLALIILVYRRRLNYNFLKALILVCVAGGLVGRVLRLIDPGLSLTLYEPPTPTPASVFFGGLADLLMFLTLGALFYALADACHRPAARVGRRFWSALFVISGVIHGIARERAPKADDFFSAEGGVTPPDKHRRRQQQQRWPDVIDIP